MENVELLNALMSDPEVRKLLVKLSKNDTVNTVLNSGNAQSNYYPNNYNNCYPSQGGNQNFGLGGLGLLFLLPLLFCGCGGGFGCGGGCGHGGLGFGRGFGFNNRCCNPCDCCDCCEFWC
ncbi:hypothetical protein [Clostridium sp.]|uniref:hypothetical protein n=1 Tax=Clostridium sp. TaxID=1506 RepID=UPI002FCC4590